MTGQSFTELTSKTAGTLVWSDVVVPVHSSASNSGCLAMFRTVWKSSLPMWKASAHTHLDTSQHLFSKNPQRTHTRRCYLYESASSPGFTVLLTGVFYSYTRDITQAPL